MTRSTTFFDGNFDAAVLRGLVSLFVWDGGPLTYHLEYSDANDNGRDDWSENGAAGAIRLAFEQWANVSGLTFTEVANAADANMVERVYSEAPEDGSITLGRHFFPGQNDDPNLQNGRQNYGQYNDQANSWSSIGLQQGGFGFVTLLHEIGHGIGLEHPHDQDLFLGVDDDQDGGYFGLNSGIYTVMSYRDGWADRDASFSSGFGYQGTPMAIDIAAVQAIYGANTDFATGNDTYALSGTNGSGTYYSTIWDAGGTDEITYDGGFDAYIFLDEATIDDTPTGGGLVSYVEGIFGGFTIAQNAVIENASAGRGDDLVVGNDADNVLLGNDGADTLVGRDGSDVIEGGAGGDLIMGDYESVARFGVALTPTPDVFEGPNLPGGLTSGTGDIEVGPTAGNTTRANAVDVSNGFELQSNLFVVEGERFNTVSVEATSGGGFAYYTFTLTERARIVLDIDGAHGADTETGTFDSYLYLEDANGNVLAENDDTVLDFGSYDSYEDGSGTYDSGLDADLGPGTYYVRIGEWSAPGESESITAGSTYTLHVTADSYVPTEPPLLPEDALGQLGFYYETPDFSDAIGGYNAGASSAPGMSKDGHAGHDHGAGCACSACHEGRTEDAFAEDVLAQEDAGFVYWDGDIAVLSEGGAISGADLAATTPSSFGGGYGDAPVDLDGRSPEGSGLNTPPTDEIG